MSYGYIGDTSSSIKQQVKNTGVLSMSDVHDLESQGFLGGSLELIEKQTITSDTAQVDFDSIKGEQYDVHVLQTENIKNASDDQQFAIRFKVGGTVDTDNDYQRGIWSINAAGSENESRDNNTGNIFYTLNQGNATNEKGNGYINFYNLHNSSKNSMVTYQSTYIQADGNYRVSFGGGIYDQAASVDGIRIFMSNASNIASGVFTLYGVKQL